ncbi:MULTISPECIES: MerR family DNA-binding transcriptional regulator [unclassified Crossiella]|uniref:MerR family DNA-binding transcriptional regulator n=1 Tax=unclassified Crossiella TaxID=2620835 RepID=UPI002000010B|nr:MULTISPECIES: MerR family DNA-binding transcriptional regulator [unclassified Crossiella]MCK2240410.1 MerR family DNA-binding transcriptional regulator [Crossiella sp. S99.2]MCK2253138.1 MerR family DNA-binding transcriptional regulator [Crossiella sp. S99.1]
MRIGELSQRTGVSIRMLRYYEEQGLLRPDRTESGYRVYAEADVDRVGKIRCMISSALPSHLVAPVLQALHGEQPEYPVTAEDCPPLMKMLDTQLSTINARIDDLVTSRDQLVQFMADLRERFDCVSG